MLARFPGCPLSWFSAVLSGGDPELISIEGTETTGFFIAVSICTVTLDESAIDLDWLSEEMLEGDSSVVVKDVLLKTRSMEVENNGRGWMLLFPLNI